MKPLFFIILTLLLMILQSIVLPSFPWFDNSFDLLIIDVLFLSLIATRHSIIFAVMAIGCLMDSISGVPFSYHVLSYLWIYVMVFIIRQLLFDQSVVFILIISLVSMIIQHLLLLFSIFIGHGSDYILKFDYNILLKQTFWGFIFIPVSIWAINIFWVRWNFLTKLMYKRIAQYRDR